MNVTEALESRYTCRAFKPEPVPKATITEILEAANRTPSWANSQPWEIFVVGGVVLDGLRQAWLKNYHDGVQPAADLARPQSWPEAIQKRMQEFLAARSEVIGVRRDDDEARRAIVENNQRFFGAPVVVYLCMDRSLSQWSVHDLGMMAQSIMLAAEERGVASAIAYNLVIYPDLVRATVGIPEEYSIVIGIALGYAEKDDYQNSFRSFRRPLDEIVRFSGL